MFEVVFAITLAAVPSGSLTDTGLVMVQAGPGPSKTGFYIVDLKCPTEGGELIVYQKNDHAQSKRTKGMFIDGNASKVTIESAEKDGAYKVVFPNDNDFSSKQIITITRNIRAFLGPPECMFAQRPRSRYISWTSGNQ